MLAESKQPTWQEALSDLITDPKELWELLELDANLLAEATTAVADFPLKVPRRLVARMQKNNLNDPLLKQILPLGIELQPQLGYSEDPLAEANANPVPGLLHKYQSRVLVTLTSACAVHCRYCFRRHFPYAENNPGRKGWEKIFAYIKADTRINEVILSGGDPLTVSDHLLQLFTDQLSLIPHVTRLRIHTRLLTMLPERITQEFINWAKQLKLQLIIVLHANHALEVNEDVEKALASLRTANVHLLNQTVLLKDINDDAATLIQLSEKLFAAGVLPYYLYVLDRVQGAAHFDIEREKAFELHKMIRSRLPGYLVPRLVAEIAGESSKSILL